MSGTEVELLPERALYWPEARLLAVADLHWGKPESFQQHGIPLPAGVLEDDLDRLSRALRCTGARRLLLVGDLIHSKRGITPAVRERIAAWRAGHDVEMVLVRGNHDRHLKTLPPEWRLDIHEEHVDEGPFRFAHHPEPAPGRSGHLHPVVRLSSGADRPRLPCFHLGGPGRHTSAMSASKRRRVLDIIATDSTFERTDFRGREVWLGKCLHCNAHLMVDLNGDPISRATIEHIIPRTHGGTDALENLGLACARCNQGKGSRHDPRYLKDARAQELVTRLQARRRERWRDPESPEAPEPSEPD